jgi:hypothetical protein
MSACSHVWIDPTVPPIQRAPVSPIIGTGSRQMQVGTTYICLNCNASITPKPPVSAPPVPKGG